jgi:ADP-L-glycero-D-manno-heptose 6-epimerase
LIIVTGGAGFIGSNIVQELNNIGLDDILVVDHLSNAGKYRNLEGAKFTDYMDKGEFRRSLAATSSRGEKIEAILHQGACSNTLEDDGVYMMDNNFSYSKELLAFATQCGIPFVYASTAAVYGASSPGSFTPVLANEKPLNVYGFSKLAFDHHVRHLMRQGRITSTVVGLRYFNVYGPREKHKGRMASVMHHFTHDIAKKSKIQLFGKSKNYAAGEQRRDFVFVRDIAKLNLFFAGLAEAKNASRKATAGIFNAGTGRSRTFNEVARALMHVHGEVPIEYIEFPNDLGGRYQEFTEADLTDLRAAGCNFEFTTLERGIQLTFAV